MSRGLGESLQSSAWLTQICNAQNKFATWSAAQKDLIVRIDICNYKFKKNVFGRTKPNCAVVSMAAKGRDNFRSCQTRNGKQCRWISAGTRIATEGVVKIMLIVTAVAAAMLLDPHASQAYEMPWCALTEIAGGAMYENCTLPTFELCVQEVIAGNRGFWHSKPALAGPQADGPAAGRPAKARRLLRDAFALGQLAKSKRDISQGGRLPFARKRPALGRLLLSVHAQRGDRLPSQILTTLAFMRIFPRRCPEICGPHPLCLFDFIPGDATNKKCGIFLSKGR
jgi:hypothetical protein